MRDTLIQAEVCQRCGSPYLSLKDLDSEISSFSQVLKCNTCGSETLTPKRSDVHSERIRNASEERQEDAEWKARMERVPQNRPEINAHQFQGSWKMAEIQDLKTKRDQKDAKSRYVHFHFYIRTYLLITSMYIAKTKIKTLNMMSCGELDVAQSTTKETNAVIKSTVPKTIKIFSRTV